MSVFSSQSKSINWSEKSAENSSSGTFPFFRNKFTKELSSRRSKPEEHPLETPKQFFQFKLVLLGESGVGKSCLVVRFVEEFFNEYEDSTVGAAFHTKTLENPKCVVKLDIWDTAGAEQFRVITPLYYKKAQAAILVYDVTNWYSFEKTKFWIKELRMANEVTVVALVGNKNDMNAERVVSHHEGSLLASNYEFLFFETSAKTGFGVNELFETVAKKLTTLDFPTTTFDEEENNSDNEEIQDYCSCCKWF